MTATRRLAGAPFVRHKDWHTIDWQRVNASVRRLQVRIAKAVAEENFGRVKALQWLLTHSYHAKLLAIKRVTSNRGKRTLGVDKILWSASRRKMHAVNELVRCGYKPLPLRRIYIPKKNGKLRPLSIPVMRDRAMQALHKMALDPVAETMADRNSYGFRYYRSCADAIGQCFITLAKRHSPHWVLEGDIKSCFDEISHQWMLDNIPMDKQVLHKWLKSGYMEGGKLYPCKSGTPQGGIISPTLANMTLDGLEEAVKSAVPRRHKVNVIRYADDFIITGKSKELLEQTVMPAIESFLLKRGLALSEEKTRITSVEDGFEFLGQHLRKYGGKLLIKPAKDNVNAFLQSLRDMIRKHRSSKAEVLINILNPKIRGWGNYHRHVVSGKIFSQVANWIYRAMWQWMKRKHSNKSKTWLVRKYWSKGSAPWTFSTAITNNNGKVQICELIHLYSIKIFRHVKIRGEANPFDPKFQRYFRARDALRKEKLRACMA